MSAGETEAIAPLLKRLLAEHPHLSALVTSTTPTGAEWVQQELGGRVEWCWAPLYALEAVRRFLEHWHPTLGALLKTEVWPNLPTHAAARGVTMILFNARLFERSAAAYVRVAGLPGKRWVIWQGLPCKQNRMRLGLARWVRQMRRLS